MKLTKNVLEKIPGEKVVTPDPAIFELPETVLQFGTGVLLRALPDYFIDKANRQGVFNGRVVVVKSTGAGDAAEFDKQDHLYTLAIRGTESGKPVSENIICSAISRVLLAASEWDAILECARQPSFRVIISNTTEVGIQLVNESIFQKPPGSFPAKLLSFLYERYLFFNGSRESGMIIIPTELIIGNADKLLSILTALANYNKLDGLFMEWLQSANHFCNSLVDRIVPGRPKGPALEALESELGYHDELSIICEVYRLWAIQGNAEVKKALSFASCDDGVIIAADIELFRELKLRLLNGTHTLCCGLAFLAGFTTVLEAMEDPVFFAFAKKLMMVEIAGAIPVEVPAEAALKFSHQTLERFRNPFIQHHWLNITLQYSTKLKSRVVPVLKRYYENFSTPPECIALGFAAHFLFMKTTVDEAGNFYGNWNGISYKVTDDHANWYSKSWRNSDDSEFAERALANIDFWGLNLSALPGFEKEVALLMKQIQSKGVLPVIESVLQNRAS